IVDLPMTSVAERHSLKAPRPPRTIGFITASAIVIANIIGTGIFTSLGFQLLGIQSGFALLMLWSVGGITAFCGAICYGELSAVQNLWTLGKLPFISVLIGAGFLVEQKLAITFLPQPGDTMSICSGAFAVALVYVMYSYSGWNG